MTDTATQTPPQTPEERLAVFHHRRELSVTQPKGSLALVSTNWITGDPAVGQTVWGVPGTWFPREPGQSGLKLVAEAAEGVTVDGEQVDGEVFVYGKDNSEPSDIVFGDTLTGTVIVNEAGTEYALRVWDAHSEDLQRFGAIDAYDYNPDWVVKADFRPVEGLTVGFEHIKEEGEREVAIPGEITFEKDGIAYNLAAFKAGRALQLVFSDSTSGTDTYSVGRFLFVAPDQDGTITLDFNNAVLPPCAFSYAFNCPMPPQQNRFRVPITAGEKQVVAKDGALLHA